MMIASTTLRAQEVKPIEASIEDYIALLNQNGYQAYSFDISPMKDATYQIQFEVRGIPRYPVIIGNKVLHLQRRVGVQVLNIFI